MDFSYERSTFPVEVFAQGMIFSNKNKKKKYSFLIFLAAFFLASSLFWFMPNSVYAADGVTDKIISALTDTLSYPFKLILLGIFTLLGWLASVAITLFEWVIKPENLSGPQGLLNQPAVYEMWKFVRDFFNLFFILVLLYTALTIVFQVAKDYKKALLHLVIMALLVNFSFPISRFLIDATNVPMYFFANQMAASSGKSPGEGGGVMSSALSASQLKGILIPGAENGGKVSTSSNSFERYFVAIIFMFLFTVTLLVLAIMFVIRMVALVILVIFSSVGFAVSVIPGLTKYSTQWWDNFWKYALYGPAAMLMMLVATRFMSALGDTKTGVFKGLSNVASGVVSSNPTFFASMAMFTIPIIMLWFAIGLAQSMSLAGAGMVVGQGKKFATWAGKKATYANPVGRGIGGGLKKAAMGGSLGGLKYGKTPIIGKYLTGDYWATGSKTEATIKGGIAGGWGGGAKERQKLHQKEVNERVKKDKENQVNNSTHRMNLKDSKDPVEREAAALALVGEKEIRTTDELVNAMDALKNNNDGLIKAIENARPEALSAITALQYQAMTANADPATSAKLKESLNNKLEKEGKAHVIVEYEVVVGGKTSANAVRDVFDNMTVEEIAKQDDLFKHTIHGAGAVGYVRALNTRAPGGDPAKYQEIKKRMKSGTSRLV